MSKYFLEIIDKAGDEGEAPQIYRKEVSDKEEAESRAKELAVMFSEDEKYYLHECNHSSDSNSPCVKTELEV